MAWRSQIGVGVAGLGLAALNCYWLAPCLIPGAVAFLGDWLGTERVGQICLALLAVFLLMPPFWLSRKIGRIRRKNLWFFRFLLLHQVLIAAIGLTRLGNTTPAQPPPLSIAAKTAPTSPSPSPMAIQISSTPTPHPRASQLPASTPVPATPPPSTDPDRYARIDQHALSTPPAMEKEVATLASYLVRTAQNDEEKVRAIYRWITDRIAYDTDSYFAGKDHFPDGSPEQTLLTRKAICDGYSRLTHALGEAAGLKMEIVSGFASGYGADAGERENHVWNAVKLPEGWRLMDSTWGAGSIGQDRKFRKQFQDYYFLTPPAQFLVTHFPTEDHWQLLLPPMTREEFLSRPKKQPEFFALGLSVVQEVGHLQADPRAVVELRAPAHVYLSAQLENLQGVKVERATLVDRDDKRILVNLLAPQAGAYRLLVFAGPADQDFTKSVLEYRVDAHSGQPRGYPEIYPKFQAKGGCIFSPSVGTLTPGVHHFEIELPGARSIFVNDWNTRLNLQGDRFVGDISVTSGPVEVYAEFDKGSGEGIATFQVR